MAAAVTPAGPLPVEGGLVATSQRGPIGESWWSQRFLAAVDTALVGGRSSRGRTYARRGQVIDLWVEPGLISARVQGTRRTPYSVRIAMPWQRTIAVGAHPVHPGQSSALLRQHARRRATARDRRGVCRCGGALVPVPDVAALVRLHLSRHGQPVQARSRSVLSGGRALRP